MKKLNVGLVGAGFMGKAHSIGYSDMPKYFWPAPAVPVLKTICDIVPEIAADAKERFGFEIVQVSIENIEFSPESRELVNKYNANKMDLKAYEDISQKASNVSAQQKIATGVQNNGFGDMGGMLFGMNMAQRVNPNGEIKPNQSSMSFDEQIETLKKLKELVDMGVLSQDEFDIKKKEIMGL